MPVKCIRCRTRGYLLSKLKDVPPEKRSARFYCVIAMAKPDGTVQSATVNAKGR